MARRALRLGGHRQRDVQRPALVAPVIGNRNQMKSGLADVIAGLAVPIGGLLPQALHDVLAKLDVDFWRTGLSRGARCASLRPRSRRRACRIAAATEWRRERPYERERNGG